MNICLHIRIPPPIRPMPRVLHHDGLDLVCPTCSAFQRPWLTNSLGELEATT